MAAKTGELHADTVGYKISLLQVAPGQEPRIARELSESIRRHTTTEPVCVLKLFGKFDLCAIYRTNNYLDGPSRFGPIAGIRGGNKINAFHWLAAGEPAGLSVERATGDVWAIAFCRLNEPLVEFFGARVESAVAGISHALVETGATVDVLGTTGWAELVVIIRCQRFTQVASALSKISHQIVFCKFEGRNREEPLAAKTFSLLGISFDITTGRQFRRKLRSRLNEPFQTGKKVFPSVSITCPPAAMASIRTTAAKYFGDGAVTFGASDLSFRPRESTWGEVIANLLTLRRDFDGNIYSTSIGVLDVETSPRRVTGHAPQRRGLNMPALNSRMFLRWGPTLEHRLRTLYLGLSNLLQDPLIGNCFEDLRLVAEERLPLLLRLLEPKNDDQTELLREFVEVLAYATEERFHGAFLSLEHLSDLSPTKGGIQRILAAASIVPRTLLARVNKTWYGFVVAGYHNEFFSSHYEALNLPFEYLFRPEKWYGLFHEVGHAAFFDAEFYDMDGNEIEGVIRKLLAMPSADPLEYSKWKDLAWEIGADMFDLYFCYGLDIDFYLKNIWPFVKPEKYPLSSDHFHRYFLVFQFWRYLLQTGADRFPPRLSIEADVETFIQRLTDLGLTSRSEISPETRHHSSATFIVLGQAIEAFTRCFRKIGKPRDLMAELSRPQICDAVEQVCRGVPWFGEIDAPDTFILGLARRPKLSLSARLAALISLWNTAVLHSARAAQRP